MRAPYHKENGTMSTMTRAACYAALVSATLIGAEAAAQDATLAPGFAPSPTELTGVAGGTYDFGMRQAGCVGFGSETPQHTIALSDSFAFLRISAFSDGDTTMMVVGPQGVLCNDDTHGLNPEVSGSSFVAGTYEIYIGMYGGGNAPYTLELAESPHPGLGDAGGHGSLVTEPVPTPVEARPGQIALAPGFAPDPMITAGTAGGDASVAQFGGSCTGYSGRSPNHEIVLSSDFSYFRVSIDGASDASLAVVGESETRCATAEGGAGPEVDGFFRAGTYQIHVGASQMNATAPYRVEFSSRPSQGTTGRDAVPPPPSAASFAGIAPGFLPDPISETGALDGSREAVRGSTRTGPCVGFIGERPNHTLVLQEDFPYLRIFARSSGDASLVVEGPAGRLCNDDFDGLNPQVSGDMPAGTYYIYVGRAGRDAAPYEIFVSEIP